MKGCTFPGSTISCDGAERCGEMTETDGTAICAVSACTVPSFRIREDMPYRRIPPKTSKIALPRNHPRLRRRRPSTKLNVCGSSGGLLVCVCDCIGITMTRSPSQNFLSSDCRYQHFAGAYCG